MISTEEKITKVKEHLSLPRESWMDSKLDDKAKWMNRINKSLDELIILIKERKESNQCNSYTF